MSRRILRWCGLVVLCGFLLALGFDGVRAENTAASLSLKLRFRKETGPGSGRWHTLTQPADWDAKKTAVVICDMWDKHWCQMSTQRVGEMAPR